MELLQRREGRDAGGEGGGAGVADLIVAAMCAVGVWGRGGFEVIPRSLERILVMFVPNSIRFCLFYFSLE